MFFFYFRILHFIEKKQDANLNITITVIFIHIMESYFMLFKIFQLNLNTKNNNLLIKTRAKTEHLAYITCISSGRGHI